VFGAEGKGTLKKMLLGGGRFQTLGGESKPAGSVSYPQHFLGIDTKLGGGAREESHFHTSY